MASKNHSQSGSLASIKKNTEKNPKIMKDIKKFVNSNPHATNIDKIYADFKNTKGDSVFACKYAPNIQATRKRVLSDSETKNFSKIPKGINEKQGFSQNNVQNNWLTVGKNGKTISSSNSLDDLTDNDSMIVEQEVDPNLLSSSPENNKISSQDSDKNNQGQAEVKKIPKPPPIHVYKSNIREISNLLISSSIDKNCFRVKETDSDNLSV